MSDALDTSVVLRLLVGEPPEQAEAARRHLEASDQPVVVDRLVIAESYFALRHHYRVPHVDAAEALLALLSSDRVSASPAMTSALRAARAAPEPGLVDRLIVAAAQESGHTLRTFDRRLARVDGARLLR
ncbi:MAG: PIN domain-containing protein [Gemmatimonadaceae bacterium]|jgi:predicted nucleic acid-binding protein|nr:PIN domain-containing protein [Gemmatimonadaceae bacterium]